MSRKSLTVSLSVLTAAVLLLMVPTGVAISQELTKVLVTNFPDPQRIDGTVSIKGPIRSAELVTLKDIIVSPVRPEETTRWIESGTLTTDGYSYLVLSLSGHVKGTIGHQGMVGVVLIPDEEPILRAFNEEGQLQFPLEVTTGSVTALSPYFASGSVRHSVAFARYRVFLYNTSDKTVSVNLFAYLTSG